MVVLKYSPLDVCMHVPRLETIPAKAEEEQSLLRCMEGITRHDRNAPRPCQSSIVLEDVWPIGNPIRLLLLE